MPSLIESIKEAEAKAAGIRRDALAQARDMVLQAEIDAGAQLSRVADECRLKLVSAREEAEYEGRSIAQDIVSRRANEAGNMCKRAEKNLDKAASYIFERLAEV